MKSVVGNVVMLFAVVSCGKVDASPPEDGAIADTSVDVPADAPDAPRFPAGTYGFEDLAGGNPTLPHDIAAGGAQQTKPAPNPSSSSGVFVVDCNGDSGAFGFGCSASRQHVPEGMKFIVYADFNVTKPLEFTFPSDIGSFSVAISLTDGSAGPFRLVAMDANNVDVTFSDVTTRPLASWTNTRVGVARTSGFRKVQLRPNGASSSVIAIDALRWTSD